MADPRKEHEHEGEKCEDTEDGALGLRAASFLLSLSVGGKGCVTPVGGKGFLAV